MYIYILGVSSSISLERGTEKENNLCMCQNGRESSPCFPNPYNNKFTYLKQWTQKNGNHIWTSYSLVGILPLNRKEFHIFLISVLVHHITFSLFPLAKEGIRKQVLLCMHNKSDSESTILTDHLMLLLWGVRNPRLYIKHFYSFCFNFSDRIFSRHHLPLLK